MIEVRVRGDVQDHVVTYETPEDAERCVTIDPRAELVEEATA